MSQALKTFIETAPNNPGVYIYKHRDGSVLYVGKAKNLRKRLYSYLKEVDTNPKTNVLVKQIDKVEIIETVNEIEALLLESNLIKKYKPKYNILLKDDKNYPYIKLNFSDKYPRFEIVRRIKNDKSMYFGPYPNSGALKYTLKLLYDVFPLRQCKDNVFRISKKACLNYQMQKCTAPCVGMIEPKAYKVILKAAIDVLNGKIEPVIQELQREMLLAADNLNFEKAKKIRDSIESLKLSTSKQFVVFPNDQKNIDFVSMMSDGRYFVFNTLFIRQGRLLGQGNKLMIGEGSDEDVLSRFLVEYYKNNIIPDEISLPTRINDDVVLEYLKKRTSDNFLISYKRDDVSGLLEIAQKNMDEFLKQSKDKNSKWHEISQKIATMLKLSFSPDSIECFDMSNLMGQDAVGAKVHFLDGEPRKDFYRKYKIKGDFKGDDLKMMSEVLDRRFAKSEEDNVADIVMLDGGRTQLGVLKDLLKKRETLRGSFSAISIAKDRTGSKSSAIDKIYFLNESLDIVQVLPDLDVLHFFQRVRDEVHRFALSYHRKLRDSVE